MVYFQCHYSSGYPTTVAGTPILWPVALVLEENESLCVIFFLKMSYVTQAGLKTHYVACNSLR